jgi:hypothetical protein
VTDVQVVAPDGVRVLVHDDEVVELRTLAGDVFPVVEPLLELLGSVLLGYVNADTGCSPGGPSPRPRCRPADGGDRPAASWDAQWTQLARRRGLLEARFLAAHRHRRRSC